MVIELDDPDAAIVVMSLMLLDELLFKSRYDPDTQAIIKRRVSLLIERIQNTRHADFQDYDTEEEEGLPRI